MAVTFNDFRGVSYTKDVTLRVDGRGDGFFRVDRSDLCGFEAIDGGETAAPRSFPAARLLASEWYHAANAQATLTPRLPSVHGAA